MGVGPVEAVETCFRKVFMFRGRTARSEFWWFVALDFALLTVNGLSADLFAAPGAAHNPNSQFALVPTTPIFAVPPVSAGARRLHDIGAPAWQVFVALSPIGISSGRAS
jgi:uncharacterized membrane protein YhaH (DUF805 family)